MKFLTTFCLCIVVFAMTFAEEDKSKKKDKVVSFYNCLACASSEAHDEYDKCEELKPPKAKECTQECLKKVRGKNDSEGVWKHFCENPDNVEKIFDCIAEKREEISKEASEGGEDAWKKFKECAKKVKDKYCSDE